MSSPSTVVDPVVDPVDPADDKTLVPIAELRKVRAEAAKNRIALQEYKDKVKSQEEAARLAGLDEISKAQELLKKAEADNKNLRDSMNRIQIESAISSLAATLGFTDPLDAIRFVNVAEAVDGQGNVDIEKIEAAIKDIAEKKPYLRSSSSRSFGGGPTSPPPQEFPSAKPKLTDQNSIDQMKHQSSELIRQGRIGDATRLYNQAWELSQGIKK